MPPSTSDASPPTDGQYVYIRSEPGLWTVGFYDADGKWEPESDHDSTDKAAARVNYLHGGKPTTTVKDVDLAVLRGALERIKAAVVEAAPDWPNEFRVTMKRGYIADICDSALSGRSAPEPAPAPATEARDPAHLYAAALLETLVERCGASASFMPEPDLLGKLTQIDNLVAKLLRAQQSPEPSAVQPDEYQQVAALVCARIDLMADVADGGGLAAVEIMQDLKKFKDKMISQPEDRQRCYDANCAIYSLMMAQSPETKRAGE